MVSGPEGSPAVQSLVAPVADSIASRSEHFPSLATTSAVVVTSIVAALATEANDTRSDSRGATSARRCMRDTSGERARLYLLREPRRLERRPRALRAADQDAGEKHEHAADDDQEDRLQQRRVHEPRADPRDRPELGRDHRGGDTG